MWKITSPDQIALFEREAGLVAVYVDNGYDPRFIKLFTEMARPFDAHVRAAWHLLIPVEGGYIPGPVPPSAYNLHMALAIARDRHIPTTELPALIFEFIPGREYYSVSLAGMDEARVRQVVMQIGEIATQEFGNGDRDVEDFRKAAHDRIVRYLMTEKLLHYVKKLSPALVAFVTAAASVKALG